LGLQRLTAAVDRNAVLIDVQPIRRTTVASNPDDWGFRIGRIYLTITARCSPRIASKGIDNGVLAASRLGVNSVPTRSAKNVKVGFAALFARIDRIEAIAVLLVCAGRDFRDDVWALAASVDCEDVVEAGGACYAEPGTAAALTKILPLVEAVRVFCIHASARDSGRI